MAKRRRRRIKIVKPFQFFSLLFVLIAAIVLVIVLGTKTVRFLLGKDSTPAGVSSVASVASAPTDTTPPVIICESERLFYIGDTMSYKKDVTVTDDTDSAPSLSVDSSAVNLRAAGTYNYTLTATDRAGNTATKTVTLTVKDKPTDYVSEADMYAEADKVLAKIITDGMTKQEQVKAIYNWARGNIGYVNHSDKTDWVQTAYKTFVNRQSDCFGYFAVTKALLNRLDIENMDVIKVKLTTGASNHYWSLVTVDGTNWYHLDTTPRKGTGDDFCMVTDDFILNYSAAHDNSHNFDRSLYPATPKE
ncbi:MAG: hypothetical protein IJW78_03850 [Clostridia bacterium]|nr:hypothetical protein [Clostridia bacterium]